MALDRVEFKEYLVRDMQRQMVNEGKDPSTVDLEEAQKAVDAVSEEIGLIFLEVFKGVEADLKKGK
jgi:division protein CdvB (Snf7/Vps24/ESCRT-III family)